jgi:phytoene/squalene synthetase
MEHIPGNSQSLAEAITRSASKQTYYTIRLFVDRPKIADAYRAYGYFRWVDDILDSNSGLLSDKIAFLDRQKSILESCYRGDKTADLCAEERFLADLVGNDPDENSGLHSYLHRMMDVMAFDVSRRGRLITEAELSDYSRHLATAVTEALYYFIGHDDPAPFSEHRYLAVTAAHITHMLRDAYEDGDTGYFNIPLEYLQTHGISARDIESQAYRQWVCSRVRLARKYFTMSRQSHSQIKSLRRRLASYAYTARFEWMLRTIERENFCLRCEYPDRKGLKPALWMAWSVLSSVLIYPWQKFAPQSQVTKAFRPGER